ncbi:hypothetical protein COU77_03855 [Candidatus Peregrinibacteria bacterium CG10_big_fil_rev_8_21_14_0_10_49_16]|nr:MAG: hypothetical protein COW95_00805 [Candidatus Peregrinibacteria bacterium CG22_combo_CG10-13_8_21_14_all_49_11]PIR51786.1 MAG: hypothetical protein COU77_03855 [Candidatus Peregrinibacteria bacterium CG10_big_fil_rev_8_21_14_0_10_49_16]
MTHTVLFVGGGSAGHIAPSVAVWRALEQMRPDLHAHFVCSPRTADRLFLEGEELPYTTTPFLTGGWTLSFSFWRHLLLAFRLLHTHKPDLIFSTGGRLSIPFGLAAWSQGIPVLLHESDAVSGRANRCLRFLTKEACSGFPQHGYTHTGHPVRPELAQGSKEEGLRITGFSGERPILLIWGASQGAQAINEVTLTLLPQLTALCDVIHITGPGKTADVQQKTGDKPCYWSTEFATNDLPHLFAVTDLAISRAGANSIAELAMNAVPTILVPIQGLAQDHQVRNAETVEKSGGCILLYQKDLENNLYNLVQSLLQHANRRQKMAEAIKTLSTPDAPRLISKIILKYIESTTPEH